MPKNLSVRDTYRSYLTNSVLWIGTCRPVGRPATAAAAFRSLLSGEPTIQPIQSPWRFPPCNKADERGGLSRSCAGVQSRPLSGSADDERGGGKIGQVIGSQRKIQDATQAGASRSVSWNQAAKAAVGLCQWTDTEALHRSSVMTCDLRRQTLTYVIRSPHKMHVRCLLPNSRIGHARN